MVAKVVPIAEEPRYKRHWYQYSLRSLLLLTTVVCVGMSWFTVKLRQAREQRETVELIERAGGEVLYDWEVNSLGERVRHGEEPAQSWPRRILGNDFFDSAVSVFVWSDADLEHAKRLPGLRFVRFNCTPDVTDAGLAHLHNIVGLRHVRIGEDDNVSAEGVNKLRRALPHCGVSWCREGN